MNYTATTSHYRNSRDTTQRRTDEEQELTSAMSTDLAICSTDRRSRPAEEEREREGFTEGERAEDLCYGGAAEMKGRRKPHLGLGGRSPDGEDRTDGIDRGASWMRGNLVGCTPRAILQFG